MNDVRELIQIQIESKVFMKDLKITIANISAHEAVCEEELS